jgi:hypothetical protein
MRLALAILTALCAAAPQSLRAGDDLAQQVKEAREELERLKALAYAPYSPALPPPRYGPETPAKTAEGELRLSGVVQGWAYHVCDDRYGFYGDLGTPPGTNPYTSANQGDLARHASLDGFRLRRAYLKLTADLTQHFRSVIAVDPAAEAADFPLLPDTRGPAPGSPITAPQLVTPNNPDYYLAGRRNPDRSNRLLQDAYFQAHIPASAILHNFELRVGQFVPPLGREGPRSYANDDFIERSWVANSVDRDLGVLFTGLFWNQRFQYYLGAFNGGTPFAAPAANRSDENDQKDLLAGFSIQPFGFPMQPAKTFDWGGLELGWTGMWGHHGSPLAEDLGHAAWRQHLFAYYRFPGPARGFWLAAETAWLRDRYPNVVTFDYSRLPDGRGTLYGRYPVDGLCDTAGPVTLHGLSLSAGFRVEESALAEDLPGWARGLEFAVRYESFENTLAAKRLRNPAHNPADPTSPLYVNSPLHVDAFRTQVLTFGVNSQLLRNFARLQFNYNLAREPAVNGNRYCRQVDNDSLVLSVQLAF